MSNEIVAVITGVTGDIGRVTALSLAKEGVSVIGFGHTTLRSKEVEAELQAFSSSSQVFPIDFTLKEHAEKLNEALSHIKNIDWVIHVAGFIDARESFVNLETIHTTFHVNLFSIIEICKLALPKLSEDGGLISISSTASLHGNGRTPLYATAKGALNTFTLSVAHSFKDTERESIVLCPGPTNTKMREDFAHDAEKHQSPDVIAKAIIEIIKKTSPYKNGDFVIIRDSVETLHSSLM